MIKTEKRKNPVVIVRSTVAPPRFPETHGSSAGVCPGITRRGGLPGPSEGTRNATAHARESRPAISPEYYFSVPRRSRGGPRVPFCFCFASYMLYKCYLPFYISARFVSRPVLRYLTLLFFTVFSLFYFFLSPSIPRSVTYVFRRPKNRTNPAATRVTTNQRRTAHFSSFRRDGGRRKTRIRFGQFPGRPSSAQRRTPLPP